MKQELYKKLFGLSVAILFFSLTIIATVNADIVSKKTSENILQISLETSDTDPIYELLILAPKKFQRELRPLVNHKEKMGVTTKLVTLDEVYNSMFSQGRDKPEKIKYFIKTAIQEWGTKYVLLVGGKKGQLPLWYFPVRYVKMECDWDPKYISDLYYADIYDSEGNFSSWDSDGDGIFGEWYEGEVAQDKNIDLSPDIAVGRLPCRSQLEVRIMVKKIINYETTTYGEPWFNDMLVLAGDTYPETSNPLWKGYEGEYYGDRAIENMTGFIPTRLYTSDGTLSSGDDVLDAFRKGWGFVYFVGHGSPKNWGNNAPNGTSFVRGLTTESIHKLRNTGMLPVCVVSGCHNLQFDTSIFKIFNATTRYHQEYVFECWGWRMTRKIGGGSIATLGCSALGYTKEDKDAFNGGINELEVQFFKQYGQNNVEILGDTWAAAISWYVDTYPVDWNSQSLEDSWIDAQVVESWTLFGDPSLRIGGYPQ